MKFLIMLLVFLQGLFTVNIAHSYTDFHNTLNKTQQPLFSNSREQMVARISKEFKRDPSTIDKIVKVVDEQVVAKSDTYPFLTRNLILSIIAVESRFDTRAEYRGSMGIMQLMQHIHKLRDPFDITSNIQKGVNILCAYYTKTRTTQGALLAYNAGIGSYLRGRYNPGYAAKVLRWKKEMDSWEV